MPSQGFPHEIAFQRRGVFGIHNGVPEAFNKYDVRITDINQKKPSHEISEVRGTNYLSDVEKPNLVIKEANAVGAGIGDVFSHSLFA